jgi:hypothetical protein
MYKKSVYQLTCPMPGGIQYQCPTPGVILQLMPDRGGGHCWIDSLTNEIMNDVQIDKICIVAVILGFHMTS